MNCFFLTPFQPQLSRGQPLPRRCFFSLLGAMSMFVAANDHVAPTAIVSVDESTESVSGSEYSTDSGKRTPHFGTVRTAADAAVGASSSKNDNASVAATRGGESPPFEESQEGQLDSMRAACREHSRNGGAPPIVPAHGRDQKENKKKKASI